MITEGAHYYIEKGIESWLDHKNYFEAIDLFSRALEFEPHNPDAHLLRGAVYVDVGDLHRALKDYNKSLEYNPENIGLFFDKGTVLFYLGEYNKAIGSYEKFLSREPRDVDALYFNGLAYHFLGQNKTAQKLIDEAMGLIEKSDDLYPDLCNAKGEILFDLKSYPDAIISSKLQNQIPRHSLPAII
nr:tetratricopeptide repeat protein [uncultured Methanobacterium sp.]